MSALDSIAPPVVGELRAIFEALPDSDLIRELRGPRRRGRPGYDPCVLWRCFVAYYALGIESVSALLRLLRNNPYIAEACGITSPDLMPSQPTMSRFGTKLASKRYAEQVKRLQWALTRRLYATLPDFGRVVALDSTPVKAWSNGGKRGKRGTGNLKRQRPRVGKVSDPDAGWWAKRNTHGKAEYRWAYKAHILCDAEYELPLVVDVTAGNVHDIKKATPLLARVRSAYSQFLPKYVLADAGYSSERFPQVVRRHYHGTAIVDPNPMHKRAVARRAEHPEWGEVYRKRSSIERLNGRLKAFYKLDDLRVRGRMKVRLHAILSVIALQARAAAFPDRLRRCVARA